MVETYPMIDQSQGKQIYKKRDEILRVAKKLFSEKGYNNTSMRDIVKEAHTSMGNLYFHFPNKLAILKLICREFIYKLRSQIYQIHRLNFSPQTGFAIDFRIGYITTLEDPKLSRLWLVARNIPEIHRFSFENKRIRLRTFFGDRIPEEELDFLAIAIQGIADAIFEQKKNENLHGDSVRLSNKIISYSLKLIGYSDNEIQKAINEAEDYVTKKHISTDPYFKF